MKIKNPLPKSAQNQLIQASNHPCIGRYEQLGELEKLERLHAIDMVVDSITRKYPECFRENKQ